MFTNVTVERYHRRHHWLWILRRLFCRPQHLVVWCVLILIALWLMVEGQSDHLKLFGGSVLFVLLLISVAYFSSVILDWHMRHIRVFSDGRLDYETGILSPKCTSLSLRFGVIRYVFHDRIGHWLDCGDLILPFGEGCIEDIPDFKVFWDIAQGRI